MQSMTAYRCGSCTIDSAKRCVWREDRRVELEAKAFDLIVLLLENRQRALGKQEIVEALWGQRAVTDAALSQLAYKARRALGDDGERQAVIRTRYGHGLQWVAAVEAIPAGGPAPAHASMSTVTAPVAGRRRRIAVVIVAAAICVLVVVVIAYHGWRPWGAPSAPPRVTVLPLQDRTGDPALAWTRDGLPALMSALLARGTSSAAASRRIDVAAGGRLARARLRAPHVHAKVAADVVVKATLAQRGAKRYELRLRIPRGAAHGPRTIAVRGNQPARLALRAVARLRAMLGLPLPRLPGLAAQARGVYVAASYARGMDALAHGDAQDAEPYFVVCAEQDPGFRPCRTALRELHAGMGAGNSAERARPRRHDPSRVGSRHRSGAAGPAPGPAI